MHVTLQSLSRSDAHAHLFAILSDGGIYRHPAQEDHNPKRPHHALHSLSLGQNHVISKLLVGTK